MKINRVGTKKCAKKSILGNVPIKVYVKSWNNLLRKNFEQRGRFKIIASRTN